MSVCTILTPIMKCCFIHKSIYSISFVEKFVYYELNFTQTDY